MVVNKRGLSSKQGNDSVLFTSLYICLICFSAYRHVFQVLGVLYPCSINAWRCEMYSPHYEVIIFLESSVMGTDHLCISDITRQFVMRNNCNKTRNDSRYTALKVTFLRGRAISTHRQSTKNIDSPRYSSAKCDSKTWNFPGTNTYRYETTEPLMLLINTDTPMTHNPARWSEGSGSIPTPFHNV